MTDPVPGGEPETESRATAVTAAPRLAAREVVGRDIPRSLRGRVSHGGMARMLVGSALSMYGDWFTTVALVVLLYRMTGSPAAPAGYMLARVLPRVVGPTPGGILADRIAPNRLVAICSVLQGVLTAAMVAAARGGAVWAIYAAVVLTQFLGSMAKPAIGCLIPRVVPPDRLQRVNALYGLASGSSIVVGPALAAPFLALWGPQPLLAMDAASFGVAAALMLTLRLRPLVGAVAARRNGLTEGLRLAWGDARLRAFAGAWFASGVVATAASAVLVLFAAQRLGNDQLMPFLYVAVGIGDVAGGLFALRVKPRSVGREWLIGFGLLEVVTIAIFTLAHSLAPAMAALAVSGVAGVVWQTWGAIDMQERTPGFALGRVNGAMMQCVGVGMVCGALIALVLVPLLGWSTAIFATCCASVVVLALTTAVGPMRLLEPELAVVGRDVPVQAPAAVTVD